MWHVLIELFNALGPLLGALVTSSPFIAFVMLYLNRFFKRRNAAMAAEEAAFERDRKMAELGDPFGDPDLTPLEETPNAMRVRHLEETRRLRDKIETLRLQVTDLQEKLRDADLVVADIGKIQAALRDARADIAILEKDGPYTLEQLRAYTLELEETVWQFSGYTQRPVFAPAAQRTASSRTSMKAIVVTEIDDRTTGRPGPIPDEKTPQRGALPPLRKT